MTDKELKHLSKMELLIIIRDQENELQALQAEIDQLKLAAEDHQIHMEKCGSIAEASLQVNGVFTAAQNAADQYLAEVKKKQENAETEAAQILERARRDAALQMRAAEQNSTQMLQQARTNAAKYWEELSGKLETFYESHSGLEQLIKSTGVEICIPNTKQEE
jgi:cell division septum initiation protein DivIVA